MTVILIYIDKRNEVIKKMYINATDKESDRSHIYNFDERIGIIAKEYSYNVKNELIIELLKLGILNLLQRYVY